MTEARISPELGTQQDSLDLLAQKYLSEIENSQNKKGLSGQAKDALRVTAKVAGGVAATVAITLGPGTLEGMSRGLGLPEALVYAIGSLPLSGTWEHMDPETATKIVSAISRSNTVEVIRSFAEELPKFGTEYRAILFEAGLMGGAVAGVERFFHRRDERTKKIEAGEAAISRKGEQIFVIGGNSSNVADALAITDPGHTVSIFEGGAGGTYLVDKMKELVKAGKSIFLNLGISKAQGESYRKSQAWGKLAISEDNLIHSDDGQHRYLLIVGCGETSEEELTDKAEFIDVTHEEVYSAADMLRSRVDKKSLPFRDGEVVKIYLGSAKTPRVDDETGKITTNDRAIAQKGGTDIYIDTWSVILSQINKRLEQNGSTGIRLISGVAPYRELVENVAKDLKVNLRGKEDDTDDTTLLVYEKISDDTLNRARRLKQEYPSRHVVALTSNMEANEMARKEGIETICSAIVIRDIIGAVKVALKEGKTPQDIQKMIDESLSF